MHASSARPPFSSPSSFIRRAAALLVCALALASAASAQDEGRYSLRLLAGATPLGVDTLDARFDGAATTTSGEVDYEAGLASGLAFGIRLSEHWEVDLEYLYRTSELSELTFPDGMRFTEGDFSSVTVSASLNYVFRAGQRWRPYVGAGLGWVQEVDIDFEDASGETSFETDDFGYQLQAGIRYEASDRWAASFEFRTFDAGEIELEAEDGPGTVTSDYTPLNVLVGVRYRF
ncbi:MAG: porin family protein [Acidobacteriota bacterium]